MFRRLLEKLTSGNTLYYPGCLTHFVLPDIEENYQSILRKIGVDFIFIPEFDCCGSPVANAGYQKDFEDLAEKNADYFKRYGVSKIISNCPACYKVIKEYEIEGMEVEHMLQTIDARLDKIDVRHSGGITYHDPCHLGRQGKIFEEPRRILEHIGFNVVELRFCRNDSMCCGGGGGFKTNAPEVSNKVAKTVLAAVETDKLVTPCPLCYKQFKDNSEDVEVLEFSQLLV